MQKKKSRAQTYIKPQIHIHTKNTKKDNNNVGCDWEGRERLWIGYFLLIVTYYRCVIIKKLSARESCSLKLLHEKQSAGGF